MALTFVTPTRNHTPPSSNVCTSLLASIIYGGDERPARFSLQQILASLLLLYLPIHVQSRLHHRRNNPLPQSHLQWK